MKRLKGGPELKMPDLRVPAFVEDLYFDLKDRRLLPLVALAIVAIIAVPFLLSGGSEQPESATTGSAPAPASGAEASLTVVKADPGLRDYRKRLRHRTPTDPFKQHFTKPNLRGTQLGTPGNNAFEAPEATIHTTSTSTSINSTSSSEVLSTTRSEDGITTTETHTSPTQIPPTPIPPQAGGKEAGDEAPSSVPSLFADTIDVRIKTVKASSEAVPGDAEGAPGATETEVHSKAITRRDVLAPAALPDEKVEVAAFLGVSPKTGEPLLLVSDRVTSIFGEGKCLAGAETCQLLEVEPGMPVTFVYGPQGDRYKMTVLKVEPAGAAEEPDEPRKP